MKYFLSFLLLMGVLYVNSQNENNETKNSPKDTAWTFEGISSFNFTQGSVKHWAQGGEDFFSALLLNDYTISYDKKKSSWENTFNYKLGGTQQGTGMYNRRKTEDIFELNSKYGYEIKKGQLFFSNVVNFKTQFLRGYEYPKEDSIAKVSEFLNPGYLVLATGFEYKYKKMLSVLISPLSGKATVVTDTLYSVPYGLEPGETFRAEMGAYLKVNFKKEIMKNVRLQSSLELFNNYLDNPYTLKNNTDLDWQTTINFKVNEYIKAVLFAHFMWNADVIQRVQIKETLGIGISYSFDSTKKK
ncbi:MAG: hypothetical protein C0599_17620 [Salinivirgaceae bacterium]|nr:MAG: hypothetical protein C0599_17620 [Salinivirgaceae bacterium]